MVFLFVPLQVEWLHEGFSTLIASKWLLSSVNSEVNLETSSLNERFVTLFTNKSSISRMDSFVPLQVTCLWETLLTLIAEERLLAGMLSLVSFAIPHHRKRFSTLFINIWPFLSVHHPVIFQSPWLWKTFLANLANKLFPPERVIRTIVKSEIMNRCG